jgi:hypothetical protein
MSEKMPLVGRLTEYALFFGILVGVAIMNIAVYLGRTSERFLDKSPAVSQAASDRPKTGDGQILP